MSGKGWPREPKAHELRADAPDAPRKHKSRYRDRKQWCRGKIGGTRHTWGIRRRTWGRVLDESCAALFCNVNPERSWRIGRGWDCRHETYCTNCGKIADRWLGVECPDRPQTHGPVDGRLDYCWCGRSWPCPNQDEPWDGHVAEREAP